MYTYHTPALSQLCQRLIPKSNATTGAGTTGQKYILLLLLCTLLFWPFSIVRRFFLCFFLGFLFFLWFCCLTRCSLGLSSSIRFDGPCRGCSINFKRKLCSKQTHTNSVLYKTLPGPGHDTVQRAVSFLAFSKQRLDIGHVRWPQLP